MFTSSRFAVLVLFACAAVVTVGVRSAPAEDREEKKTDELNADWIEKDLKVAKRLTAVAEPQAWSREELLRRLGSPAIDAERDLDHGGVRLELRLSGGYASGWVQAVLHADKLLALDVRFRPSRDSFERTAERYGEALGDAYVKRERDFHLRWEDAKGLERFRKAARKVLGSPPVVRGGRVPAELHAHVKTLTDPTRSHDVGTTCYYAGTAPDGRVAIDALVASKRLYLVRHVLHDVHPEGRVYAALALLAHERSGAELLESDRKAIAAIRKSKVAISTCSGCAVYDQTAEKVLGSPR